MEILQIAYKMPYPVIDGGSFSMLGSTNGLLTTGANIKTVALNSKKNFVDVSIIPESFKHACSFEAVPIDTRIKIIPALLCLLTPKSYFTERYYHKSVINALDKIFEKHYDIVILEHVYLCTYLPEIRSLTGAAIIVRTQNVEFEVWKSVIDRTGNFFLRWYMRIMKLRLKKFEINSYSQVDGIIAMSDYDEARIKSFGIRTPVTSLPVALDFKSLPSIRENSKEKEIVMYYLGSLDWIPNQQGLDWFLKEVLPIVVHECPEVKIRIAGRGMPIRYKKLQHPNLIIDGEVESAIAYQKDKHIMIAPMVSGGGIKAKIIEGMALGKAVVTTGLGIKGINGINGKHYLFADDSENFAMALAGLYHNPEKRTTISKNARDFAKKHFDVTIIGKKTLEFVKSVQY